MLYESCLLEKRQWRLNIDLAADLKDMAYKKLINAGFQNVSLDRAVYQYYNVLKRIVAAKPRKIHKSKEFICPESYRLALKNFEEKVQRGDKLTPFLSEKLKDASYSDGMLNDWNIYHFHLTNRMKKNGWARRSDYELFAYVTETDMYFVQIYEHKNPLLYCQQDIIRIIYDNWPMLLDQFHLKDICSLTEVIDDEQYKKLREANISTFVELGENLVFGLIGGGYMSDGSSGEAMNLSDFIYNRLREIEKLVVMNMSILCEAIGQVAECNMKEYNIRLLWMESEEEFTFCELNSHIIIQLNMKKDYWRVCQPFEVFGFEKYKMHSFTPMRVIK